MTIRHWRERNPLGRTSIPTEVIGKTDRSYLFCAFLPRWTFVEQNRSKCKHCDHSAEHEERGQADQDAGEP
jgi:hypothetical protein